MTDYTELKRAASEAKNWGGEVGEGRWYTAECFKRPYFSIPDAEFIAACEPGAVLALINDIATLKAGGQLLVQDRNDALAERDQLKAENEALREEIEHSKTNPLYSTRANSRRYVWLRDNHIGDNPEAINLECGPWPGLNSAIDAAMGKGEKS